MLLTFVKVRRGLLRRLSLSHIGPVLELETMFLIGVGTLSRYCMGGTVRLYLTKEINEWFNKKINSLRTYYC